MTATASIPTSVSPGRAAELTKSGARVIDVRMPGEFESAHIPGSYNIPQDDLSEHCDELANAVSDPVILVCSSGVRAREADSTLRRAGLQSLTVLEGGLNAWEREGFHVMRGRQKWSLERQVRFTAGSLVVAGTVGGLLFWRPLSLISLFVGGGLTVAGLTDKCGMAMLFSKLPYNRAVQCDVSEVIDRLSVDSGR